LRARPPAWPATLDLASAGDADLPIHSSFTPLIGLALKLVRLTRVAGFSAFDGFQVTLTVFNLTAASSP
jgi:hypothetical protein